MLDGYGNKIDPLIDYSWVKFDIVDGDGRPKELKPEHIVRFVGEPEPQACRFRNPFRFGDCEGLMPKMILRRVLPGMILTGREDCLLVPVRPQDADAVRKWKGQNLRGDVKLPRHLKGHNLYHAVIDEACNQWDDTKEPHPKGDADLLRYWLQYKVGPEFCWRDGPFPPEYYQTVVRLLSNTRADDRYSFVEPAFTDDGEPVIYVYTPKSEAFEQMEEEVARKLRRGVFELIELTLGIENAESLVKEKERAA